MKRIGVLALQGDFLEHMSCLDRLGAHAIPVRLPGDMDGFEGLVIPGGESTTISDLMEEYGLASPIRGLAADGTPVWGTCAGMILMAREVEDAARPGLGLMDIRVRRNAYGSQVDSFETEVDMPILGDHPLRAVFIRAPVIQGVGNGVEVLARLADGTPVAVRQGNLLASAFHPELTRDLRFHAYFLNMTEGLSRKE